MNNIDWNYASDFTDKFRGKNFKVNPNTEGKDNWHTYKEVYEKFLPQSKKILEIGTSTGGFVKFCKEQIDDIFMVGSDIVEYGEHNKYLDDVYLGNSYESTFLDWIKEKKYKFDLVIDDGPHNLNSQMWIMNNIDNFLLENGSFICEDVQTFENAEKIKSCSPFPEDTYIWDNRKGGRWDDLCVIIDRRKGL